MVVSLFQSVSPPQYTNETPDNASSVSRLYGFSELAMVGLIINRGVENVLITFSSMSFSAIFLI